MNLNKYIDHTLLKQDATKAQILELCKEAREYDFMSVCINPYWIPVASEALTGSDVKVCTVIGFPLGANATATKAFETREAIAAGADEVDMVINVGALKDKDDATVEADIRAVVEAAAGTLVKVIIETCLLTDEEKVRACKLSVAAGADYVKTSTGFSTGGATVEDVRLMKETVGDAALVKASGGVRNLEDAQKMIDAGASRIGTSNGVMIVSGETATSGY
ncbi:deoxyribose-phosphate aldolase [Culicoidibacter larvae]|uniref:Deoxyribose-phosphate aldolase n=1 Tax=Culicoidibacter larvae TaxID=2579976 RepID=A0A5R8Q8V2_9FIRM|nr:deoxyribose-phosphate aldolase [Culicoidibacter larvae]TLG72138.1 deoxyribose-phosphate aldolase [Culicoidibacter larvae]